MRHLSHRDRLFIQVLQHISSESFTTFHRCTSFYVATIYEVLYLKCLELPYWKSKPRNFFSIFMIFRFFDCLRDKVKILFQLNENRNWCIDRNWTKWCAFSVEGAVNNYRQCIEKVQLPSKSCMKRNLYRLLCSSTT